MSSDVTSYSNPLTHSKQYNCTTISCLIYPQGHSSLLYTRQQLNSTLCIIGISTVHAHIIHYACQAHQLHGVMETYQQSLSRSPSPSRRLLAIEDAVGTLTACSQSLSSTYIHVHKRQSIAKHPGRHQT